MVSYSNERPQEWRFGPEWYYHVGLNEILLADSFVAFFKQEITEEILLADLFVAFSNSETFTLFE